VQCYVNALSHFDINTVLNGIQLLLTLFRDRLGPNPVLNTPLPLINKTPNELIPFIQKAVDFLQQISNDTNTSTNKTAGGFDTIMNQAAARAGLANIITVTAGSNNHPDGTNNDPTLVQLDYVVNFHYIPQIDPLSFNLGLGNSDLLSLSTQFSPTASFDATVEFGLNALQGAFPSQN